MGRTSYPNISELKELRILECKEEITDQYTGSYEFDPFFKSIKFLLSMRDKSKKLAKSFIVTNPERLEISE